jgi:hypothetical protein
MSKSTLYKYWSNEKGHHYALLFECEADNILEADKQFEIATGMIPVECSLVSCQPRLAVVIEV